MAAFKFKVECFCSRLTYGRATNGVPSEGGACYTLALSRSRSLCAARNEGKHLGRHWGALTSRKALPSYLPYLPCASNEQRH